MKIFKRLCLTASLTMGALASPAAAATDAPIKVVIVGLVHGHVNGLLRSDYQETLELVGIYETDLQVVRKYQDRYDIDQSLLFSDLNAMLAERSPEAAWVFTNTHDHLKVVETCAARGVHVIVEKPLAVDKASADRMAAAARAHNIHLMTNLETTWYSSLGETYRLAVEEKKLGPITKIVSHFGHKGPGPEGINVSPEFFAWLSDPELNGGGASADFGCYGQNIITWLLGNQRPLSVTAVFQTNKPETYRKVDDNATIIVEYPDAQGIIQASWDWPFPRKDVHVYGRDGIIRTIDPNRYDIRLDRGEDPAERVAAPLPKPYRNTIEYFAAVIRGEIDPKNDLSSLENHLIAMEIMEAARESARIGKTIRLTATP